MPLVLPKIDLSIQSHTKHPSSTVFRFPLIRSNVVCRFISSIDGLNAPVMGIPASITSERQQQQQREEDKKGETITVAKI